MIAKIRKEKEDARKKMFEERTDVDIEKEKEKEEIRTLRNENFGSNLDGVEAE